jgi:nucleotide-binding universal stress UspA family protein
MSEKTLVPFDGTPLSRRALERAVTKHRDDRIVVLYVIDPVLAVYDAEAGGLPAASTWDDRMRERAEDVCAQAERIASDHGCEVTTAVEVGRPARTVVAYAGEHGIEHVIMGSHGRDGVSRLILGSVAEEVVRHAPVPVTVVR